MSKTTGLIDDWAKTRLLAEIWWCGDYYCNCTQPHVQRIKPNVKAGYPWLSRDTLWQGTFRSDAEPDERKQQQDELMAKATEYGIPLDAEFYGIIEEPRQ